MAPGVARILPLALALAAGAKVVWERGAPSVSSAQGCAALGRCCPGRDPMCAVGGPRRCYCDQACVSARDCCADYAHVCPERLSDPLWVAQLLNSRCGTWSLSGWRRCAKPCQVSYRIRRRRVLQEPRNGGAPCPPLEEQAGCVEYWNRPGVECQQALIPALITTGSFGREREKRGVPKEQAMAAYCVQFRLGSVGRSCGLVRAPHTQWTRYLTPGHMVCVRCEWPAQDARSQRCYGDGGSARRDQPSLWQAAGHPRCRGTWMRLRQLQDCSCPEVHSLVFI
ncbi:RPE-spondin [Tupaia chinensis]|uniref:RPE-spondin n=1 Tax=Tupaia chinensis TaxID=246437 RepID=L9LAL6_TUPCH|nr:RPE-spondin [Tupaia chinensis]